MFSRLKSLLLSHTTARQIVFKNTVWLFAGEFLGRLIRFFIVVYSARLLGAADYGIFSYALTIAAFVTIFSDIGISAIVTRETSKSAELRQKYFGAAFVLKMALIVLNIAVVLVAVPAISRVPGALPLLPLVVCIFLFDSIREFGFGMNRALERMEREAFIKIVMNLAISALGFVALWLAPTPYSLAISYAIGSGIGCLITLWVLREYVAGILREGVAWHLVWPIFKMAWPIGLLGLLGAIMINTDMVMLGWWETPEHLGYYAAAQKIILLLYIVPTLIGSAVFPVFSRLAQANRARFREVFEKSLAGVGLIAIPLVIGGLILSRPLLHFVFGALYEPAADTLAILFITILLVYPSTLLSNALFAHNQQKQFMYFVAIGALSNALCNYLLIPRFGIAGAALATVGSQLLTNILVWRKMKQVQYFSMVPHLYPALFAGVVMGVAVYSLQTFTSVPLVAIIMISIVIYVGVLLLLREKLLVETWRLVSK